MLRLTPLLFRWRLLLCLSLVNGLYMWTGLLLNFKEISRIFFNCCEFKEPFLSKYKVVCGGLFAKILFGHA